MAVLTGHQPDQLIKTNSWPKSYLWHFWSTWPWFSFKATKGNKGQIRGLAYLASGAFTVLCTVHCTRATCENYKLHKWEWKWK